MDKNVIMTKYSKLTGGNEKPEIYERKNDIIHNTWWEECLLFSISAYCNSKWELNDVKYLPWKSHLIFFLNQLELTILFFVKRIHVFL